MRVLSLAAASLVIVACGASDKREPTPPATPPAKAVDVCANASKIDVVLAAPRTDQERVVHGALQRKIAAARDLTVVAAPRTGACAVALEVAVQAVERTASSARVAISVTVYREPGHEKLGAVDKKLTQQDLKPEEMAGVEERLLDLAGGTAGDSFVQNVRAFFAE